MCVLCVGQSDGLYALRVCKCACRRWGGVNGRVDVWVDIGVSGGGVFCVCVLCKWVCVLRCWEGSLGLWQVGLSGAALPPAC